MTDEAIHRERPGTYFEPLVDDNVADVRRLESLEVSRRQLLLQ